MTRPAKETDRYMTVEAHHSTVRQIKERHEHDMAYVRQRLKDLEAIRDRSQTAMRALVRVIVAED